MAEEDKKKEEKKEAITPPKKKFSIKLDYFQIALYCGPAVLFFLIVFVSFFDEPFDKHK